MQKQKSIGLIISGLTEIISGLGGIILAIHFIQEYTPGFNVLPIVPFLIGAVIPALTLFIVAGILVLFRKPAGRILSIAMAILFCLPPFQILQMAVKDIIRYKQLSVDLTLIFCVFALLVLLSLIFFFTRPKVKEQFKK